MGYKILHLLFVFQCFFVFDSTSEGDGIIWEVVTPKVTHAEGPHWDKSKNILYFVDTNGKTVNSYNPKTKEFNKVHIEGPDQVNLVITDETQGDRYLISRGRDIVAIKWDGVSQYPSQTTLLTRTDKDKSGNMINDGKADSRGQLWAGSKGPGTPDVEPNQARFYSFDSNFKPTVQLSPVTISNGIAWSNDDKLLFYIDSPTRKVDVFDFDINRSTISNRRTVFSFDDFGIPSNAIPDGMDIDENDNLWVAALNASSILHVNSKTGELINRVYLPTTFVTSCAFGGDELEHLYVTTSQSELKGDQKEKEPDAGSVFRLSNLGVRGQNKPNKVRMN